MQGTHVAVLSSIYKTYFNSEPKQLINLPLVKDKNIKLFQLQGGRGDEGRASWIKSSTIGQAGEKHSIITIPQYTFICQMLKQNIAMKFAPLLWDLLT